MRFWPARCFAVSLAFGLSCAYAAVPQRIGGAIDSKQVQALRGNVPAAAMRAADLGPASPSLQLGDLSLRFTMSAPQQAALDQLLLDQQDPASSRYHQWLTPEQFAAQFGLAQADLAKVSSWLAAQGFTVTQAARGGTFIRFSGTAAQVQAAFGTQLHTLSINGERHFGNLTEPTLPAAIAAVTGSITGLHDFHPKPHNHRSSVLAPAEPIDGASPAYTSSTSGNHYIAPGDFYTVYDESALLASGINGTGVTVAVMGQTDINLTDISNFRAVSGITPRAPIVQLYGTDPGIPSSEDLTEAELDIEWSGATAPNATILFVNSTDVIDGSLTEAIDNNLAPILTVSYGLCEGYLGRTQLNAYNTLLQMANAQGQAVVAAAGDAGATDCDTGYPATGGLAVDFPAALPTVVGVGGTMYNEGTGTYFATTNNSNGGSALSYIPEAAWNESSSSNGLLSGGGGASAYFTKPVWQVGSGVPADSSRDVPDVSLNAAAVHDPYLICVQGYCTNGYRNSSGYLAVVGGTSVGAPAFAGLLALVQQQTGSRLGNPNPKIYALANSTYYGSVFHDVTTGSNASPCIAGSTNCPSGGTIGYNATAGYDLATGWGSVDAYNLVTKWNLVTPVTTPVGQTASLTSLSGTLTAATAGTPIPLSVTVASGSTTVTATPTGTVQFLVDNVAVGSPVALTSGSTTYSLPTANLTAGAHTVTAAYSGDATFSGSKASFSINITAAPTSLFTLSPATLAVTLASGGTLSIPFTVTPVGGFAGTVQLSAIATSPLRATFSTSAVSVSGSASSGSTLNIYAYSYRIASRTRYTEVGGVALAGLLLLVLPKRRRLAGLLACVLSIAVVSSVGCGQGGVVTTNNGTNIPAGTYIVNVTAAAVSGGVTVTHTSVVTVTVQ